MKSLRDKPTRDELVARVDKLTPETKALWGKMNATQVLRHMTMGVLTATGDTKIAPVKSPMPKFLMKIFLLNIKPPKAKAETFKEMNMVANGIMPTDFEAERANLKAAIDKVFQAQNFLPETPMSIKMRSTDWGKLGYNHTDHHLRQFGV
ncbi:MAG TPA: DUF1569 domain-containing protein [Chitinophagales bacterium]|nr:DUF1569 domain-containing protein [Chitinophagales bacterium]